MSIKITWLPNLEVDIAKYQIYSSLDNINFTLLVEIIHNLLDPGVYDTSTGRFFYYDLTGTSLTYYKIRALDSVGNESAFTVTKQAGPPLPPVCVVFGTILNVDGTAVSDAQVQSFIKSTEKSQEGQIVDHSGVTSDALETFTDENGYWELELIRNATVNIIIPKINLNTDITVPNAASAELTTII